MNLYLIRHGETTQENVDPNRPLTEKGRGVGIRLLNLSQGDSDD